MESMQDMQQQLWKYWYFIFDLQHSHKHTYLHYKKVYPIRKMKYLQARFVLNGGAQKAIQTTQGTHLSCR